MAKITSDMAICAYKIANDVFNNKLTRTEGKTEIARLSGMGVGSAGDYITVFLSMMDGQCYKRTINLFATEYYLEHIGIDYGIEAQQRAAKAVSEHVQYYKTKHGYLAQTDALAKKYM